MPNVTGLSFDIKAIKQADEAIKELVEDGQKGVENLNKAWKNMTKDGLNHFIERLRAAQKDIAKLSSAQIKVTVSGQADDLKKLGDSAGKAVPQVNRLLSAMQQLSAIHVNTVGSGGVSVMDAQKVNYLQQQIKLLQDQLKIQQEIGQAVERQAASTSRVRNGMSGIEDAARKVRQIAGTLFSIQALSGYVNKLVAVRGEFELQKRALQAIIQNIDEANKLWEKTVALAVQSPFRVRELVTYTKQLAAYRVETEKLYDTTKMLADVSAGLGVDMNRLILAFGQVKAANFLRGTELRQFSEAGINILGELATYFTELEGRVVTVGDVFERVSKRMVSFADVEEIFKRITSDGGAFFNMQEIQAETLKGQIANLKDSIDLMLNDIGKANEKTIKNMVAFTRTLVEGWRVVGGMLSSLGAALTVVTIARAKDALATNLWSKANIAATATGKGLTAAVAKMIMSLKGLWAAMLSNPITATYAALAALAVVIYKVVKRQRELNREYEESVGKIHAQYIETKKYADSIKELVERQNELIEANKNLSQDSDEYKENQREISDIEERRKEVIKELIKIDPEYAKSIKNAGSDLEVLIPLAEEYNEKLRARLALESSLKEINVDDSSEKYNDAATEQRAALGNLEKTRNILLKQAQELLSSDTLYDSERKALEDFVNGSEPYYKRAIKLREDLQKVFLDLGTSEQAYGLGTRTVKKTGVSTLWQRLDIEATSAIEKYIKALGKLSRKEKKVVEDMSSVAEEFKGLEMGARLTSILADENATQEDKDKAKNQIIDFFEEVLNEKGIVGAIADKARSLWSSIFNFDWEKVAIPTKLTGWRAAYDEFLKTLSTDAVPSITEEEDESDYIETLKKTYESYAKDIEGWDANNAKLRAQYTKTEMDGIKAANAERKKALDWLVYEKKTTDSDSDENKELKRLNERIRLVRELRKEYEDLSRTFGKAESEERVRNSYREAWESIMPKDLSIDLFDFTDPKGVVKQLEELKSRITPEAIDLVKTIQKAIAGEKVEIDVDFKRGKDEELLNEVEDMFDRYDLTLELKKLNIPPDLAKSLFGIESINLSDIREKVQREIDSAKAVGGQDDRVAQLEKDLEKIDDMEDKAQMDRLKKYLEYTRAAIGERAKIKVEEMNKLQEIDETFTKAMNEAKTEEDKKRIAEQKKLAEEGVRREASEKTHKLDWEDFKASDTFINLFNDLDNASSDLINHTITQIEKFKTEWTDMPVESAKEMALKLNDLQLALMDTDKPLKDNKKLWKELGDEMEKRGIKGRPRNARAQAELAERVTSENKDYEIEIEMANKRVAVLETINNLNAENKAQELAKLGYTKDYVKALGLSEDVLTNSVEANQDLIKGEKVAIKTTNDKIAANRKVLNTQKQIAKNSQELNNAIGTSKKLANDLYNSFKELTEVLGGDGPAMIFADMGMSMANTVLDTIMLIVQMNAATIAAQGLGAAMKSASGIIGWIVMAIELLVQAITAVVNYAEKMRQMKLDILAEQVDNLKQKYDALAESIEKAWSYKQLEEYSKELEKVQAKMEDAQKDYIKLLESGKDGDVIDIAKEAQRKLDDGLSVDDLSKKERKALLSEEYQDYKEATDALAEMQKDHEEQKKELLEELGGVTDPKDAAEEFVDVWLDAYKETGDGLSGLNENFDEFFENLIKKKAAMLVAEKALTGWVDAVNDALDPNKDGGYDITDDEQKRINVEAERAKKEANDLLLGIFEGIGVNKEGGLSGLQKGIQGLSEETGQIIEAYLNSIRGYVSEQVTHTKNIYNILYDATRSESRALWVRLAKQ